jgi:hypothetical protein
LTAEPYLAIAAVPKSSSLRLPSDAKPKCSGVNAKCRMLCCKCFSAWLCRNTRADASCVVRCNAVMNLVVTSDELALLKNASNPCTLGNAVASLSDQVPFGKCSKSRKGPPPM